MPTITISIPEDMQQRLEQHKAGFNVSRTCQEALDLELGVQEALSGENNMKMVERLRPQAEQAGEDAYREGRVDGINWAQKQGNFKTLSAIKRIIDGRKTHTDYHCDSGKLLCLMTKEVFPDGVPTDDGEIQVVDMPFVGQWVSGFAIGATNAFDEVLPDLG